METDVLSSLSTPASLTEVQDAVRQLSHVRPIGGGSKPALSRGGNLSLRGLTGVLEYDPAEFTFTALAGTTVAEVQSLLARHGQYMPFDPPLADAGATLGGTVAAGLSGPGRFRYGGVRDFLLRVRVITGDGRLVAGGAKVVKNAAGFDVPKLMAGSLGRFGVIVEMTFKVFPKPEAYATLAVDLPPTAALETITRLAGGPADLACLDLEPAGQVWRLGLRVGSMADALDQRVRRLRDSIGCPSETLQGDEDEAHWQRAREFAWVPTGHAVIKLPLSPGQIPALEQMVSTMPAPVPRRYSVGGHLAWLAWPESLAVDSLDRVVRQLGRRALAITGDFPGPLRGDDSGAAFAERLLGVFDPAGKFSANRAIS
jgi:glycolate oxidase FAD binding subunit